MSIDRVGVGFHIMSIRKELGLNQTQFGELIGGVHKSVVSKWEKGQILPKSIRLEKIAELGGISVERLLNRNQGETIMEKKTEKQESTYIEHTIEHVTRTNHRQGIHIWLDETEDGEGIAISMNHNFNESDGSEDTESVIQVLEDTLKSVKLRAMGSEHPEIAEFMKFIESLESEGEEDE